jgi:hypothetical protein
MVQAEAERQLRLQNHEPTRHAPGKRGGEGLVYPGAEEQTDRKSTPLLGFTPPLMCRVRYPIAFLPFGMRSNPPAGRTDTDFSTAAVARVLGPDLGGCLPAGSVWDEVSRNRSCCGASDKATANSGNIRSARCGGANWRKPRTIFADVNYLFFNFLRNSRLGTVRK